MQTKIPKQRAGGDKKRAGYCHRYFPFVWDELVDADGSEDVVRAGTDDPVLTRGFFCVAVASLDDARGAASFITIFACISSSFEALTFFGQNSVTNLEAHLSRCSRTNAAKLTSRGAVAIGLGPHQQPASEQERFLFACR